MTLSQNSKDTWLDRALLTGHLWKQRVHEQGKCDRCGRPAELALITNGPVAVTGNGLLGICMSCFIKANETACDNLAEEEIPF